VEAEGLHPVHAGQLLVLKAATLDALQVTGIVRLGELEAKNLVAHRPLPLKVPAFTA